MIFKKKMPESFAHERCLDHLMRNSMRKAPCRCLAKSCAKLLADGAAKSCAKLLADGVAKFQREAPKANFKKPLSHASYVLV